MSSMVRLKSVVAREVLDSRGFPTVEVELHAEDPHRSGQVLIGRAIVPSGASTGEGEALELRDGDKKRFFGKGVLKAVANVREKIAPALMGRELARQSLVDDLLIELDGTPNKSNLGANAMLAVSMAFARVHSLVQGITTTELIATMYGSKGTTLPAPLMNILNGGKHADNGLAIQEFMIVPTGFPSFHEALRAGSEIFQTLKKILHHKGLSTGVGDEGGFAPVFEGAQPHEQAILSIMQAIETAGYKPGKDVFLALDSAASEFCEKGGADAVFYHFEGRKLSSDEMIQHYRRWLDSYPIISIEDGLAEHDWIGWTAMTEQMGKDCQLVGDDLFVTNVEYLRRGIEKRAANSILIKLNQIGTLTETLETMRLASQSGYAQIASHRSGESEDTFLADLAVGTDCGQIKTGSASRTDRIAKYNELLRIEERLGGRATYAGKAAFSKGGK